MFCSSIVILKIDDDNTDIVKEIPIRILCKKKEFRREGVSGVIYSELYLQMSGDGIVAEINTQKVNNEQ